jgi:hypothetical protein
VNKLTRQILTGTIVFAGMGTIVLGSASTARSFVIENDFTLNNGKFILRGNASSPASTQPEWEFGWVWQDDTEISGNTFLASGLEAGDYNQPDVTLSTWFITNEIVPLENGAEISFDTKQLIPEALRPNRLEVRYNITSSCRFQDEQPANCGDVAPDGLLTPELAATVGDFTYQFLKDDGTPLVINPDLIPEAYPNTWTRFTGRISGLTQPASGRIGFRYFVPKAALSQSNASYIGIDNFKYQTPPESVPTPAMLPGLFVIGYKTWRKRKHQAIT